jgi:hypothetical protein
LLHRIQMDNDQSLCLECDNISYTFDFQVTNGGQSMLICPRCDSNIIITVNEWTARCQNGETYVQIYDAVCKR